MKIKEGSSIIALPADSLGAGGEATVFAKGSKVYKIYHDRKKAMSEVKVLELASILTDPHVVRPLNLVYDPITGETVGYSMVKLPDTEPLCKFFTRTFKDDNNISPQDIVSLNRAMQMSLAQIHQDRCLVVDLNELNVMVDASWVPWFIDTDSYQTPNFRATAIMESIRDHAVKNNKWTEGSDNFSLAVLMCQTYLNIHPYKGNHPKYKPKDWIQRMEDGVSIFDKDVKLPPVVNPFNVIPKPHLDWLKAVFCKGDRSAPPMPEGAVAAVPASVVRILSSGQFSWKEVAKVDGKIRHATYIFGDSYVTVKRGNTSRLLKNNIPVFTSTTNRSPRPINADGKVVVVEAHPIADASKSRFEFFDLSGHSLGGAVGGKEFIYRNNTIYITTAESLVECSFKHIGSNLVLVSKAVDNLSAIARKVYRGCVVQNLLGRTHLTIPYKLGSCRTVAIPEVDGYRVIDAVSDRHVTVVVGERKGKYARFVFSFDTSFSYTCRKVDDITYNGLHLTVLENGISILQSEDDQVEVFVKDKMKLVTDPPFDGTMPLFSNGNQPYFVEGSNIVMFNLK